MTDTTRCRCHLPLVPPDGLACWWPRRDPEPGDHVLAVAMHGDDARFLRLVRVRERWYRRGAGANHPDSTPPVPWSEAGRCWAGTHHAVVDATDMVASAEQRPRLLVTVQTTIGQPPGSGLSRNGSGAAPRRGSGGC